MAPRSPARPPGQTRRSSWQVTVETTGTLLVGPDIAAAATVIHALGLPLIGLNCATGPKEMAEHVRWLAANWPGAAQPAAQCGAAGTGERRNPLPARRCRDGELGGAVRAGGRAEPGGRLLLARPSRISRRWARCCASWATAARRRPQRSHHWVPSVASLYGQTPLRQENSYFSIGERCNANGSKKWRELQERGDWDGCVAVAASRWAKAATAWTSAPPSSGATRWRR